MATPRLFISSTCYDLQEVRYQLRTFIEEIGYEPVMSEFGDIFYDYKKHVQDSCKAEIDKCQLFILIIGNHYGSFYHKQKEQSAPDSVTLQELRKALETNIYKHIFVNRYVDYDYKNYLNALKKFIAQKLDKKSVNEEEYEETIQRLKEQFMSVYFYPQESYKNIFNFLDLVYSLESNNVILPYESFDDIKDSLRKQWAGFMYDSIEGMRTVSKSMFDGVSKKMDKIEHQLKVLIESQSQTNQKEGKVNVDLQKLISEQSLEDFDKLREKIFSVVNDLLIEYDWNNNEIARISFNKKVELSSFKSWIDNLSQTVLKFKWAKTVDANYLFKDLIEQEAISTHVSEIPIKAPIEFAVLMDDLKQKLDDVEYNNLIDVLLIEFNKFYSVPPPFISDPPAINSEDLPF